MIQAWKESILSIIFGEGIKILFIMSSKRKKLRKIFSRTLQGQDLEDMVNKLLSPEPLFPESFKRAKERVALIDIEKLREEMLKK